MMKTIVYSYIAFADSPKEAHYVRNAHEIPEIMMSLKVDDILNIQGLGRMRVVKAEHTKYPDEFSNNCEFHEVALICAWESDALVRS